MSRKERSPDPFFVVFFILLRSPTVAGGLFYIRECLHNQLQSAEASREQDLDWLERRDPHVQGEGLRCLFATNQICIPSIIGISCFGERRGEVEQ